MSLKLFGKCTNCGSSLQISNVIPRHLVKRSHGSLFMSHYHIYKHFPEININNGILAFTYRFNLVIYTKQRTINSKT